jgi:heptosyltransferase-2
VLAAAGRIRELRADLALIFPNSTRGALEARLAGVPVRVGFANGARFLLLTHPVARPSGHSAMRKRSKADIMALLRSGVARKKYPAAAHQAHDYLALVAALGGNPAPVAPSIHVTRQELQAAVGRFGLAGDFPGALPLIGLNAGAEYGPAKRWPAERFVAAATQTHSRVPCAWVIFGSQADQPLAARIEAALKSARLPVLDLAGRTSRRELCALLKLCKTVLTNDTGPMHLAAAVGTPVVVPFGSTSPELTGPGLPGSAGHALLVPDVPCAPCFLRECPIDLRCLKQVTPGQASAALLHTLRAAR